MPQPATTNQLLWPRIECSEFQGLGPVSTLKSHELRVGQWGVGNFTKENKDAFIMRRIGGAGRHKQRYPLYLPNIFCIFVVILTVLCAHHSYYSFVLVRCGLLTYTFLCTVCVSSSVMSDSLRPHGL